MGTINEQAGLTTSPVSTGDNSTASSTGTAVGEEADSTGDNSAAYGRRAEASGQDASAFGAEALAPAQWNTVLGFNAGDSNNGDNVVIVGRNGLATGDNAVVVGENAEATAVSATAVGWGAEATAENATAIGEGTKATLPGAVAIGDRDYSVSPDRGLVYEEGAEVETLADLEVDSDLSEGDPVAYSLEIGGVELVRVRAEADGDGGVQNPNVFIPEDLTVDGETTEVEDVVTGSVVVEDGNGAAQFTVDATEEPAVIDVHGNTLDAVARIVGEGGTLEIDGDLAVSGEISENQDL
ncbi:MAG: hypothetical protein ACOCUA_03095 [archaeon]